MDKDRAAYRRCKNCIWYTLGRCRRRSPAVTEGWPVVDDDDWCGDFKLIPWPASGGREQ